MSTSLWLELALNFQESLETNLPALVDEINAMEVGSAYPIVMPAPDVEGNRVSLDIDPNLINGNFEDFPRIQVGVFSRDVVKPLQQNADLLSFPYVIEIYVAGATKKAVFVQSVKWGLVLDQYFERYGNLVYPTRFRTAYSTNVSLTFSLPKGRGTSVYYTKLISADGEFAAYE